MLVVCAAIALTLVRGLLTQWELSYVERGSSFLCGAGCEPGRMVSHGGVHDANTLDDLPVALRSNVDKITLPFSGNKNKRPVWNAAEIDDVICVPKDA